MTPSPDTELSSCCHAPMIVAGDSFGEGTNHYECTKCGNSCNRAVIEPQNMQPTPATHISPTENTEELEKALLVDPVFQHILKFAPQSQRELMTFELARYFSPLIRPVYYENPKKVLDRQPTENTEEPNFRVSLNKLVDDDNMPEVLALIASREHQAVQAFGEKVLKELDDGKRQHSMRVIRSVITSLLKGANQ